MHQDIQDNRNQESMVPILGRAPDSRNPESIIPILNRNNSIFDASMSARLATMSQAANLRHYGQNTRHPS